MANYNGASHYTHEIDKKYLDGWNAIFNKKDEDDGRKEEKEERSASNSDVPKS